MTTSLYSPIPDSQIDNAVRQYVKEHKPKNLQIKWQSIEYRLPNTTQVERELAYWRTCHRYGLVEPHNYKGATILRIPSAIIKQEENYGITISDCEHD